jgi:hypothetical protein
MKMRLSLTEFQDLACLRHCRSSGVNAAAVLRVNACDDDTFSIRVASEGLGHDVEDRGESVFEVLCAVRRKLESVGWLVRCAGAQVDVFPSPMIASMGDGTHAYVLTLGKPALTADLVDLFHCDDRYVPSTVEEQEKFCKTWVRSLRTEMEPVGQ